MAAPIYIKYSWNTDDLVQAYKYHKKSSKYFWLSRFIVFGLVEVGVDKTTINQE